MKKLSKQSRERIRNYIIKKTGCKADERYLYVGNFRIELLDDRYSIFDMKRRLALLYKRNKDSYRYCCYARGDSFVGYVSDKQRADMIIEYVKVHEETINYLLEINK